MNLYSLYDYKANCFSPPISLPNDTAAERYLAHQRNSPTMISDYPSDYGIFCVAVFDSETGEVSPIKPRLIINAIACPKRYQIQDVAASLDERESIDLIELLQEKHIFNKSGE